MNGSYFYGADETTSASTPTQAVHNHRNVPATREATYIITLIDIDDLTAIDLSQEAHAPSDSDCHAASVQIDLGIGHGWEPEAVEVLFVDSVYRAGVAHGAPADWTDADSIEDAVERYLEINGKEMTA